MAATKPIRGVQVCEGFSTMMSFGMKTSEDILDLIHDVRKYPGRICVLSKEPIGPVIKVSYYDNRDDYIENITSGLGKLSEQDFEYEDYDELNYWWKRIRKEVGERPYLVVEDHKDDILISAKP